MLVAGCSHTSGSEIDGQEDSKYNRKHSYGGVLAAKMGYELCNIAEPGSTNPTIARSIIQWFKEVYDPETMEVFVVVGWTESMRMEVPTKRISWYDRHCTHWDYFANSGRHYWRINLGWMGIDPEEKELIPRYHKFMTENEPYLQIVSANAILQIQYLLRSLNVDYVMCNTMHLFTSNIEQIKFYVDCMDKTKYMHIMDENEVFFWKYRNLGYVNTKAKFWHHNEVPHQLFAEELYNFIERNKTCS